MSDQIKRYITIYYLRHLLVFPNLNHSLTGYLCSLLNNKLRRKKNLGRAILPNFKLQLHPSNVSLTSQIIPCLYFKIFLNLG